MKMFDQKVPFGIGLLAAAAFVLAATAQSPAVAAKPVPSLDIVPADAAFCSVLLRNREQYDAIVNSKAFAKLVDLPYVQMGLGFLRMQAANPEAKEAMAFLANVFSDEAFVYGGPSFNQAVELMQGVYSDVYFAQLMEAARQGAAGGGSRFSQREEAQGRAFVQGLVKRLDLIKFPELVIGGKVRDRDLAVKQLARLESDLQKVLAMAPPHLQKCLQRTTIDGHSYLVLTLDGAMVPWDPGIVAKIHSLAATPDDGDRLIERLKKVTLAVSLGLRDDYLVLAIGPSTDVLARLGSAPAARSLPELAAVGKFADKRICSVGYVSKTLNEHFSQTKSRIDNVLQTVLRGPLQSAPIPPNLREEIAKDATDLVGDIEKLMPEVGATASVGFLTSSGRESYDYDWSEHPELDSSKPLDLLKHVGGDPIVAVVGRSKVSPEAYDLLLKGLGIGYRYFEKYGLPSMKPKERAEFDRVFTQVKPLLGRLDKTTRELLIPALEDGQTALVIDAKFSSRQFVKTMPPTEQPLPMVEPALVFGVSDAAKLQRAFTEYYAVADEFVEVFKGVEKSEIPKNFKLPRPRVYHLHQGTVWGYPLPAAWGVDSRVLPNAGMSDNVAVLSLTGRHAQRLLAETEPKIAGLNLPTRKPLAAAGGVDFAALVDALSPWVDLALDKYTAQRGGAQAEMARQHAKTVLEVLKVYRGTVFVTYVEDKATVTHSRSEIHDLQD